MNKKKTHTKRLWKWIPKSIQSECSTLHCNPTTMHSIIAILSRFCMFKLSFDFRALCRIIPTNWHKFVSDNSLCVCVFFFSVPRIAFFFLLLFHFLYLFFIWPRTNSNNELWAIIGIVAVDVHRLDQFACAWCIGAYVASEWIGGGYFVYIMYLYMCDRLLVSICELFCRPRSCNCFQRSFTALERNYDHIYVYFSTESILYMLFVPYAWRKGKRKKNFGMKKENSREIYIYKNSIYNLLLLNVCAGMQ